MIFRFDNLLEEWATLYKPLAHDPSKNSKDKSFYRIKTINTENAFARNINTAKSPAMLYSVMVDAQTAQPNTKAISYRYEIYFASKAATPALAKTAKQSEDLGTDQQLLMDEIVQDLLAYLYDLRNTGVNPITAQPIDSTTHAALRGLQLEKAEWASIPIKFNEWHIMGLSIEGIHPRLLCVNKEKYTSL